MEIALYNYEDHYEVLDRITELMQEQELCYSSFDLIKFGIERQEEIAQAVRRAMRACVSGGIPLEGNFKLIYTAGARGLMPTWELSETAFKLSIINADGSHPSIARMQIDLIKNLIVDI